LFDCRLDETREQWMRLERAALELGVKLDADEPRVAGTLDHFGQAYADHKARTNRLLPTFRQ